MIELLVYKKFEKQTHLRNVWKLVYRQQDLINLVDLQIFRVLLNKANQRLYLIAIWEQIMQKLKSWGLGVTFQDEFDYEPYLLLF